MAMAVGVLPDVDQLDLPHMSLSDIEAQAQQLELLCLVVLSNQIRPDSKDTITQLQQGYALIASIVIWCCLLMTSIHFQLGKPLAPALRSQSISDMMLVIKRLQRSSHWMSAMFIAVLNVLFSSDPAFCKTVSQHGICSLLAQLNILRYYKPHITS